MPLNQVLGGLGRVSASGIYRSNGHMEFPKFKPKFFLNGRRPKFCFNGHDLEINPQNLM